MRIGIVGAGFGARVMAPAFDAHDRCTVVDVASTRDETAALALCRRDDVDLVAVHSPPFLHERHVMAALDAGHHVLCDKPFGADEAAARRMAAAAAASGRVHLLNFEFRFEGWRTALAELVAKGNLGEPRSLVWHDQNNVWSRWTGDRWQLDRSRGGGWLGAAGSHVIDCIRWVLSAEVTAVTGVLLPATPGRGDADTGATFHLGLDNGAWAAASTTGVAALPRPPHVVVNGTEGTAWRTAEGGVVLHRVGEDAPAEVFAPEADPFNAALARWVETVRAAVEDGASGAPTFADGLACATVLQRIRGS